MATTHTHFRLLARADQQAFLELPWGVPLEEWPKDLQVEARGRLARPPQPIDVPPIAAVEPRLSNDGPSGHWATA